MENDFLGQIGAPLNYAKVSLSLTTATDECRCPTRRSSSPVACTAAASRISDQQQPGSLERCQGIVLTRRGRGRVLRHRPGKIDEILNSKGRIVVCFSKRLPARRISTASRNRRRNWNGRREFSGDRGSVEGTEDADGVLEEQANRARRGLKLSQELEVHEFSIKKSLGVVRRELADWKKKKRR